MSTPPPVPTPSGSQEMTDPANSTQTTGFRASPSVPFQTNSGPSNGTSPSPSPELSGKLYTPAEVGGISIGASTAATLLTVALCWLYFVRIRGQKGRQPGRSGLGSLYLPPSNSLLSFLVQATADSDVQHEFGLLKSAIKDHVHAFRAAKLKTTTGKSFDDNSLNAIKDASRRMPVSSRSLQQRLSSRDDKILTGAIQFYICAFLSLD